MPPEKSPRTSSPRLWIQDAACNEEIAARAFELWRDHGRPPGRQKDFWMEAERQVHARRTNGEAVAGE